MPLYKNITEEFGQIWVWKLDNSEESLVSDLPYLFQKQLKEITYKTTRLHFISTRFMLSKYANCNFIFKSENGVPKTKAKGDFISISHDNSYAAVANSNKKIGIDVQELSDKVIKISSKFVHFEDSTFFEDEVQHLTLIWAAKEALYKYLRKTGVVFKEELKITQVDAFELLGEYLVKNECENVRLKFLTFEDYILVYTI